MPEFLESSNNIFAVIMVGIFLAAGVKVWKENRESAAKKKDEGEQP